MAVYLAYSEPGVMASILLRGSRAHIRGRLTYCLGGRLGRPRYLPGPRSAAVAACPGVTAVRPGLPPDRARGGHVIPWAFVAADGVLGLHAEGVGNV